MNTIEAVTASAIGALIYAVTFHFVRRVMIPYYQSLTMKELELTDTWHAEIKNPSGNEQEMTMQLSQRGRRLIGSFRVVKKIATSGQSEIKDFSVDGSIRHRFVVLTARNSDKRSVGVAVFLLEVIGDGREMCGLGVWYSITQKKIQHTKYADSNGFCGEISE